MFVILNIAYFGELLRKYVHSFRNRLKTSDSIIVHGIYLPHLLLQSGLGGVIYCRRNYNIVLSVILYFDFFEII